jgi:predicted membrane protein DUF2339
MDPAQIEKRFADIEARLALVEVLFSKPAAPAAGAAAGAGAPSPAQTPRAVAAQAARAVAPRAAPRGSEERPSSVTSLLGWGGAAALVLAAAYLIRLAVESGWLTPMRQVAFATLGGLAMIAAGFVLRGMNRYYAGLLPAGGVAILFLSIYGAHLFYGFIEAAPATAAVVLVCVLSLWLCRAFESDLYALFAVAGSYSAPVLISGAPSITDLVIYFSAWSVVFSVFSIWHGRRLIYLLALYLALVIFDFMFRGKAPDAWAAALAFQTIQFAIFGTATAMFSVRNQSPLDQPSAMAHLPPLLLFYFLQYALLKRHMPELAPWIAVGSGVVVAGLYAAARAALQRPLPGGELLLWTYVALVLFHAGYIESVPHAWAPWVAFLIVPVVAVATMRTEGSLEATTWPVWLAGILIFAINYLRVVFDVDVQSTPARAWLAVAYAAQLYVGYYFLRGRGSSQALAALLLYLGHICAMAAALHLVGERIVESTVWGIIALVCLGVSLAQRDRVLGQTSLFVFGAAAAKVLLYDLGGASPMIRIISLVVLGVTFYVGGLLYQRMLAVGGK